jgi:DNA-directed RNA polymerase subunit RPC12/RpoP
MTPQNRPRVVPDCCPQCGANLPSGDEQVVYCEYCGSRLIRIQPQAQDAAPESPRIVRGMHLKPISCVDTQGLGIEAFRLLIPAGWDFQGGVTWVTDNPGIPAYIAFQVRNPGGVETFEVFPTMPFYWTNNPTVVMMFPIGSRYFGNEVRPPAPVQQVMQQIVLPRLRGQMSDLRLLNLEEMPELVRQVQATRPVPDEATFSNAARARIQYRQGDQTIEEEIFGVVEGTHVAMPVLMGMMEHIYWQASYLFSWRAVAGRLDESADIFQSILYSIRINPEWFGRCVQISQYLIQNQIQQIQNIGQLSRYISQINDQISDEIMASYNQRQAVYDRVATQFSQAIRGVEEYYDPNQDRTVELPGMYNYAWSNSLGEYYVTDDPNFDPNVGSNLNWDPLDRR